jgi:hypothetical protein
MTHYFITDTTAREVFFKKLLWFCDFAYGRMLRSSDELSEVRNDDW